MIVPWFVIVAVITEVVVGAVVVFIVPVLAVVIPLAAVVLAQS